MRLHLRDGGSSAADQGRRSRARAVILASALVEVLSTWLRSGRFGGNLVVRCRDGHLFMTTWIPMASVKSLRLGPWRVQRCPVGRHWTIVTPVKERYLSEAELRAARETRDVPVP